MIYFPYWLRAMTDWFLQEIQHWTKMCWSEGDLDMTRNKFTTLFSTMIWCFRREFKTLLNSSDRALKAVNYFRKNSPYTNWQGFENARNFTTLKIVLAFWKAMLWYAITIIQKSERKNSSFLIERNFSNHLLYFLTCTNKSLDFLQDLMLNNFRSMFGSCTPWKCRKNVRGLRFQGV